MKLAFLCLLVSTITLARTSSNHCDSSAIYYLNEAVTRLWDLEEYDVMKKCSKDSALTDVVASIAKYGRKARRRILELFAISNKKKWVKYNGHCYLFERRSVRWADAAERCTAMGGYLVHTDTKAEHKWLKKHIKKMGYSSNSWWMGLTQKNWYYWIQTNRKPVLNLFATGHPKKRSSFCVYMHKNYWYTEYCNYSNYFICEKSTC